MNDERYIRDPKHGQLVPQGTELTRFVMGILPRIHADALHQVRRGSTRVDLSQWVEFIALGAQSVVASYWTRGYRDQATDLLEQIRRRKTAQAGARSAQDRRKTKSLFAKPSPIRYGFLVAGSPDVANYLRQATFSFAQSTLDTVSREVGDAIEATRQALGASAAAGESQAQINHRLQAIFTDPARADRIGVTEACRISAAAAQAAAIASGVCGTSTWLANSTACPICKALDGKEVALGTPFAIIENGNPAYRVVLHPPRHPRCLCVCRANVDLSAPIPSVDEMKIVEMTNVGKPFKIKPRSGVPQQGRFVRWESPEVRQGTY